jgi:hypothetical protein
MTYTLPSSTALTPGAAVVVEKTAAANPTINVGAGGANINNFGTLSTSYAYNQYVRVEFFWDGTLWLARPILMQGSFGLSLPQTVSNANFNDLAFRRSSSSFYMAGSSKTNNPPTATPQDNGWLEVDFIDEQSCRQTYRTLNNRDTWVRNFVNNTPSAWSPQYHAGNVVGAVSQSDGAPTGAIIQRGSNVNGEFTRFADGTQFAGRQVTMPTAGLGQDVAATGSWPIAFSAAPTQNFSVLTSLGSGWQQEVGRAAVNGVYSSPTATTCVVQMYTYNHAMTQPLLFNVSAYGRWYNV